MNIDRQADLHYAFQFGQDFARTGDASVESEFNLRFPNDDEAREEFRKGMAHERESQASRH